MNKILIFLTFLSLSLTMTAKEIELSSHPQRGVYSTRPARNWEESVVTGNGVMGAMVAGNPYHETIIFNHAQLFLPLNEPHLPVSQGKHLSEVRQMLFNDKYGEASQYIVDLAKEEGFNGIHWSDPYYPAFQLNIVSDSVGASNYARTVNFNNGEIDVKWRDANGTFSRRMFISRPDKVCVLQLTAEDGGAINATLNLSQVTNQVEWWVDKFNYDEGLGLKKNDNKAQNKALLFRGWFKKTWIGSLQGYEGVVKVVKGDGKINTENGNLVIRDAKNVLLYAWVEPSYNMKDSKIKSILKHIDSIPADYAAVMAPHERVHKDLFERVSLDLNATAEDRAKSSEELLESQGKNPALIEKLFDAGRYNILSATGDNPPNLQGIWGGTVTPPWSSDFTTNGNLPVAVSHYLQANTPELMLPLFDKLESFIDDFRTNAKVLFNCRGIYVPSHFATHGLNNHFDETWPMTFWTVASAWYSMFYYDYYLYTQDKEFLRKRALPFMEQSALFYEDFLKEGDDGKLVFCPSYSPENHPLNSPYQACINATMEVMGVNALLRAIIDVSKILNVNQDKIGKWETMLAKMPEYELNENGEIREWLWKDLKDNHEHRHASQLFGLYDLHDPIIMNSEALKEGCKRAIERRMAIRRRDNGGIMAFGMVQLAFAASSMGESETAYDMVKWLGKSYWNNNLVSTHDPGGTFNVDISGGYPSLVMKMLVYSELGEIALLPATPKDWAKGSLKGAALRGGILLKELKWDGTKVEATLLAQKDQTVRISVSGKTAGKINLKAGQPVKFTNNNLTMSY